MDKKLTILEDCVDITDRYKKLGVGPSEFISDGYLLELILLSAIRSDGLSNLGYSYSESFIVKMGSCYFNATFGYIKVSKVLKRLLGLDSNFIKLKDNNYRYKQLSLLFNLFYDLGISAINLKVYDVNVFIDIGSAVTFTVNRAQHYIRNLKETIDKTFEGDTVRVKGKYYLLNMEAEKDIEKKLEKLGQLYSDTLLSEYMGNVKLYASLGGDSGILFLRTHDDYIHAETTLNLSYDLTKVINLGYVRVTAPNLGYNPLFDIEEIVGYEENSQLIIQLYNDVRAGFNFVLGVLDAWTSIRDNRRSVFK